MDDRPIFKDMADDEYKSDTPAEKIDDRTTPIIPYPFDLSDQNNHFSGM